MSRPHSVAFKLDGIVGNSPQIHACSDLLDQAARSEANVLITGPTGSGKGLFARAIHRNSSRRRENFVVVDCAALPDSLVESALFGHEKGAFTGADKAQNGLIRQAHGGTLFLDEVGLTCVGHSTDWSPKRKSRSSETWSLSRKGSAPGHPTDASPSCSLR